MIDTREAADGENRVTIEFTANDQSLNRRDEFLYTLLALTGRVRSSLVSTNRT